MYLLLVCMHALSVIKHIFFTLGIDCFVEFVCYIRFCKRISELHTLTFLSLPLSLLTQILIVQIALISLRLSQYPMHRMLIFVQD